MSSKVEVRRRPSLTFYALTMIVVCTSVWWVSADAHPQQTTPAASRMVADLTSWSFERPGSNKAPHLVISTAKLSDTPLYGSVRIAGEEATNPTAGNTITRQFDTAASVDRTKGVESGPLALSSLRDATVGLRDLTNRVEPTSPRQTIQKSPGLADAKVYNLRDDGSAAGSFLYGYQANYLPSKQWVADNEFFTHEVVEPPRPHLQLEFGGWPLPLVLSGAAGSR